MPVLKMLSRGRHITNIFHRLSCMSKTWHNSVVVLQCMNTESDDGIRRNYSSLSGRRSGLQLQKCQNSPLYMADSKRHFEYNIFYLLIDALEHQFLYAKSTFGLDWWATIILCTMPYRVALACFLKKKQVEQKYKSSHIFDNLLPSIEKKEKRNVNNREHMHLSKKEKKRLFAQTMKAHQKRLYKEENFNPWAMIIYSVSPLPFWIANSWALRNLSGAKVPLMPSVGIICPDMQTGGMLWFTNLCEADPYHILPVLTGLSFLLTLELNVLTNKNYGQKSSNPLQKAYKVIDYFFRGWCIFAVYLFWNLPTALTWYWCTSGMIAMILRLCLLHPEIDRRLAPPNIHHIIDENPYRTIVANMNKRYNPRNWFIP